MGNHWDFAGTDGKGQQGPLAQTVIDIRGPALPANDPVNSPSHYMVGGIETAEYIAVKLTPDEWRGYCKGNALKYLSRAGRKGDEAEDIKKAAWYLNRWINGGGK